MMNGGDLKCNWKLMKLLVHEVSRIFYACMCMACENLDYLFMVMHGNEYDHDYVMKLKINSKFLWLFK